MKLSVNPMTDRYLCVYPVVHDLLRLNFRCNCNPLTSLVDLTAGRVLLILPQILDHRFLPFDDFYEGKPRTPP